MKSLIRSWSSKAALIRKVHKVQVTPTIIISKNFFSTQKKAGDSTTKPPDDFYDEEVEAEKEFFDIIDAVENRPITSRSNLQGITVNKTITSWKTLQETAKDEEKVASEFKGVREMGTPYRYMSDDDLIHHVPFVVVDEENGEVEGGKEAILEATGGITDDINKVQLLNIDQEDSESNEKEIQKLIDDTFDMTADYDEEKGDQGDFLPFTDEKIDDNLLDYTLNIEPRHTMENEIISNLENTDVHKHLDSFEDLGYYPESLLNFNHPWRKTIEYPDDQLNKFIPHTDPDKFRFDFQGERACPGKRQKQGLTGVLRCHKLDITELHYLDVANLQRFLSTDSEILRKTQTGLCSKCQRKVAKCIKKARNFGILPHIGEFVIKDGSPQRTGEGFHDSIGKQEGIDPMMSKTVLT